MNSLGSGPDPYQGGAAAEVFILLNILTPDYRGLAVSSNLHFYDTFLYIIILIKPDAEDIIK